jgi:hypothetical protein
MQDRSIGVLALAPGRAEVAELRGTATIAADPAMDYRTGLYRPPRPQLPSGVRVVMWVR